MEGKGIMKRIQVFTLTLLVVLTVCPSLGQPGNESGNETILQSAFASGHFNQSEPAVPNLSYIWSVTGIESSQVIMALSQNGSDLYGRAKYEPDSGQAWNAVVTGYVKGDQVDLVLTALQGSVLSSSRLKGTYDDTEQSIKGDLFQVSNGNVSRQGKFEAVWINPDISGYTEAPVPSADLAAAGSEQANATMQDAALPAAEEDLQPAQSTKSGYYHDVRQDADRILTGVGDISQIPIGMGGSGLS